VRRSHDVGHDAGDERFPNREEPVHASSGFRRGCSVAKGAISTDTDHRRSDRKTSRCSPLLSCRDQVKARSAGR
jgi:hypothetical protein